MCWEWWIFDVLDEMKKFLSSNFQELNTAKVYNLIEDSEDKREE